MTSLAQLARCHRRPMHRTPFLHPSLLAQSETQRDVFTAEQARRLVVTRSTTSSGCAGDAIWWRCVGASTPTRHVRRCRPGTQHGMRVAALGLALTAPATLSHESAAAELGLQLLDADHSSARDPTDCG